MNECLIPKWSCEIGYSVFDGLDGMRHFDCVPVHFLFAVIQIVVNIDDGLDL